MSRRRLGALLPPVLVYAAVTVASSFSFAEMPVHVSFQDKLAHLVVYGVFGLLAARAATRGFGLERRSWRLVLGVSVLAAALGAIDEVHQHFVPGRQSDLLDALADVVGGALGAGAWAALGGRAGS